MARKFDKAFFAALAACGLGFVDSATAQVLPRPYPSAPDPKAGIEARTAPGENYAAPQGNLLPPLGTPTTGNTPESGSAVTGSLPYPGAGGPAAVTDPGSSANGGPGQAGGLLPPGGIPGAGNGADASGGAGALGAEGAQASLSSGLGGTLGGGGSYFGMIGDQGPLSIKQVPGFPQPPTLPPPNPGGGPNTPTLPRPNVRSLLAPSIRGFKIAENQSPIPQDRIFYSFNYFNDVNKKLNDFFQSPIDSVNAYRHVFGFEKTIDEGRGSIGLRLPLNSVNARNSRNRGGVAVGGNATALGDLTVFGKYVFKHNPETGSLASFGLAVTPPTGPASFANAPFLFRQFHTTTIQPFVGYYLNFGDLFVHGFSAIDVPVNFNDVTMLYNDIGLGYYLYRDRDPDSGRLLTAIAPTLEAHINTPLNHRGEYDPFDPAGTPDVVNITSGVNFEFARTAVATLAIVNPVTGPRPFDFEVVGLLNIRFGGSRASRRSIVPMIGG